MAPIQYNAGEVDINIIDILGPILICFFAGWAIYKLLGRFSPIENQGTRAVLALTLCTILIFLLGFISEQLHW
jgi:hypothetical protein